MTGKQKTFEAAGALILIALAVVLRLALIARGWPLLDSDEGTMGLMAIHIEKLGEHPLFFYGQGYMGATEAYMAALAFHFFGVSAFTLRLGLILIYVIFLVALYLLTRQIYSKGFALCVLALLALGSNAMLARELVAVGGDPETLMSSAIIMCLATWLALTMEERTRRPWRRLLAYGAWGLTVGFGFFSHMLVAPFVLLSGLLLLFFCWREVWGWGSLSALVGLVIGGFPLIVYNIRNPDKSTLFYVLHAVSAGGARPSRIDQIKGALLVSLPTVTGANPLCSVSDALALNLNSAHALQCAAVHAGWSAGVLILWFLAAAMVVGVLWSLWRRRASWTGEERREIIKQSARLSLLAGAAIALILYIISPNSALYPVATSRYLIGVLLCTPALLWPLWRGINVGKPLALSFAKMVKMTVRVDAIPGRLVLLVVFLAFLFGSISTFSGIPASAAGLPGENIYFTQNATQHPTVPETESLNNQERNLMTYLLSSGNTHIYSDYWTCDRLIFQSQERITCSAIGDSLGPGHDRYLPYRAIVNADPHAAYVLLSGSPMDKQFQEKRLNQGYQYQQMSGYTIYYR